MSETQSPLPLEGVPVRLFAASPAKLGTFLDCPRRYRFAYVDRPAPPKGPAWAHQSYGTTLHNALRAWYDLPAAQRDPEVAVRLVARCWQGDGYRDEEQAQRWRTRAVEVLRAYLVTLDPADEPVGVERTVGTTYKGMALSGRVDRVDRRGDEVVVVDYKTGRRPLSTDDVRSSLALAVYAAATERTFRRRCRTVELHHLPTGEVHQWTHTDEALTRHLDRAQDVVDAARDAQEFPARPGPQCSWCDHLRVCEEGRASSTPRLPWEGLDEPLDVPAPRADAEVDGRPTVL